MPLPGGSNLMSVIDRRDFGFICNNAAETGNFIISDPMAVDIDIELPWWELAYDEFHRHHGLR